MPKTEKLELYYMSSADDLISDFIENNVEGNSTAEKLETAYNELNEKIDNIDVTDQLNELETKVETTINEGLATKQDKLTAGTGITISSDGTISVSFEEAEGVEF